HVSRALRVEVDISSVRRIFGAIVQSLGGRHPFLISTCSRNRINIEVAVALADERQRLAIGRPSMPVGWRLVGYLSRRAASDGHDIDLRFFVALRVIADGKFFCIWRDPMIVVAARGKTSIDLYRIAASKRQAFDAAIAIEEERLAIMCPVGRFEAARGNVLCM